MSDNKQKCNLDNLYNCFTDSCYMYSNKDWTASYRNTYENDFVNDIDEILRTRKIDVFNKNSFVSDCLTIRKVNNFERVRYDNYEWASKENT